MDRHDTPKNRFLIGVFLVLISFLPAQEECTTAVISGAATVDGRPLLWKNRDTTKPENEVACSVAVDAQGLESRPAVIFRFDR